MADLESDIILVGIEETVTALKAFDKKAVKNFNAVINSVLSDAESAARGFVKADPPMRGWKTSEPLRPKKTTRGGAGWPAYNQGVIQHGIRKTKAQGKVRKDYTTSAGALVNESAAGVIIEVAGRKSGGTGTGIQFIKNLTDEIKNPSRLIWRSVDERKKSAQIKTLAALDEAKAILQKNLDRERE
jgi:hypothetical protein